MLEAKKSTIRLMVSNLFENSTQHCAITLKSAYLQRNNKGVQRGSLYFRFLQIPIIAMVVIPQGNNLLSITFSFIVQQIAVVKVRGYFFLVLWILRVCYRTWEVFMIALNYSKTWCYTIMSLDLQGPCSYGNLNWVKKELRETEYLHTLSMILYLIE